MNGGLYILLDDKKRGLPVKTFYNLDKALFERENKNGYGVYFAVNEFNCSDGQMQIIGAKTKRHNDLCTRLRYVYADLDIGKAGDGQTRETKENKKKAVIGALMSKCPPTFIIDTSNGVQPLWELESGEPTDENKKLYIQTIKGAIEWSKQYGCMADNVHDIARILRLPGYFHQKEESYLCKIVKKTDRKYDLFSLSCEFPYTEEVKEQRCPVANSSNPIFQQIEGLDFQELMIRAFASIGVKCEFDKTGRVILNDRLTGTFQGRKGDRQYLASSSHEPFKGNKITAVADILGINYKDAYKWMIKEYGLDYKQAEKQKLINPNNEKPKTEEIRYTWGTDGLNALFAVIKRKNLIVLAAKRGLGKTTYTFDMATKNALMGHKVLYISLEMSKEAIKEDFARKYAGWTVEEEYYKKIPETKQQAYERRLKEIEEIPNLNFEGLRRGVHAKWETLLEIINKYTGLDLIFIDNLDKIAGDEKEDNNEKQKRIMDDLMGFTEERQIPVILIHHHRKTAQGKDFGMDELSGSGKIADSADIVVKVLWEQKEEYPDKYATKIQLQKARGYPLASKTIFFIKGTFVDVAPPKDVYYNNPPPNYDYEKDDKMEEIARLFGK